MQWRKEGSLMSVVISLIWKLPPTTSCFSILFFFGLDADLRYRYQVHDRGYCPDDTPSNPAPSIPAVKSETSEVSPTPSELSFTRVQWRCKRDGRGGRRSTRGHAFFPPIAWGDSLRPPSTFLFVVGKIC